MSDGGQTTTVLQIHMYIIYTSGEQWDVSNNGMWTTMECGQQWDVENNGTNYYQITV
jgi:hypothetical protein